MSSSRAKNKKPKSSHEDDAGRRRRQRRHTMQTRSMPTVTMPSVLCSVCSVPLSGGNNEEPQLLCSTCRVIYNTPANQLVGREMLSRTPTTTLLKQFCERREWDHALRRLAHVPEEAKHVDEQLQKTALLEAVMHRAPLRVIQPLLAAYREATSIEGGGFWCPLKQFISSYCERRPRMQQ